MTFLSRLKDAARKRAEYRRTVEELSRMSVATAIDLDIYHGDIDKIAHRAVYGK